MISKQRKVKFDLVLVPLFVIPFSRTYIRVMMPGLNLDNCNGDITIAYKYTMAVQETELEEEERKLILDYYKNEVFV